MGIIRVIIRVLTVGLATLGAGTLMHVVALWLKIEDEIVGPFYYLPAILVGAAYLLYHKNRIPKDSGRRAAEALPFFVVFPLVVVVAALIGSANQATSTELPEWLKWSLLLAVIFTASAAAGEWHLRGYPHRRGRGEVE